MKKILTIIPFFKKKSVTLGSVSNKVTDKFIDSVLKLDKANVGINKELDRIEAKMDILKKEEEALLKLMDNNIKTIKLLEGLL